MSKFSGIGNYKKSVFDLIAGLAILAVYTLVQADSVDNGNTAIGGINYKLSASSLDVSSKEELALALDGYVVDEIGLSNVAKNAGITALEFKNSVKLQFVFQFPEDGFQGLILKFQSDKRPQLLKPFYDFVANDIRQKILKYEKS
ncbi:hypothetical protein ACFL17_04560 [Pseudomonadota bacterium]